MFLLNENNTYQFANDSKKAFVVLSLVLGKRAVCAFHRISSDLPAYPRHPTRRTVGHGWSPTILPCGYGANAAGKRRTNTYAGDKSTTKHTEKSFVLLIIIPSQVQMIHGAIILQSKSSISFNDKQESLLSLQICCIHIS